MVTILKVALYLTLILTFSLLLPTALGADNDSDGLDDQAESALCGRDAVRQALAATDPATGAGQCASSTDFAPGQTIKSTQDHDGDHLPDSLEAELCSKFADPPAGQCKPRDPNNPEQKDDFVPPTFPVLDSDGDAVPDDLEPAICLVEDQNTELDGRCDGSDYHPVRAPGPSDFDPCRTPNAEWTDVVYNLLRDTDCDGETTQYELESGCNAADPAERPRDTACTGDMLRKVVSPEDLHCDQPSNWGQAIWAWMYRPECAAEKVPPVDPTERCGYKISNPVGYLYALLGEADCDGYTNQEEIEEGCNPLDPAERPRSTSCTGDILRTVVSPEELHCDQPSNWGQAIWAWTSRPECAAERLP